MISSFRIIKNAETSKDGRDIWITGTILDNTDFTGISDIYADVARDTAEIVNIKDEIEKKILSNAEKQKQKIIEAGKIEAEEFKQEYMKKGYEEGYKKGYEQGYEQSVDEAKNEAAMIRKDALDLIHRAQDEVLKYFDENKNDIINLAGDMAESIANMEIDLSQENIVSLLKPALHKFRNKENIIINCHPSNADYVRLSMYKLENICQNAKIIILEDASLEENGCTIEDEEQIMDLQIKKQIKEIFEKIKKPGRNKC